MALVFKKATKSQAKLRAAVYGPSGAGKTYTSLRIATGLAGSITRIAVIDTEHGTASKYAGVFDIEAIKAAGKTGEHGVLVIDSLSHAWQSLLEEVDKLGRTKFKGNKWSAWSEGTPKQKALVEALLAYPGHVIVTMRAKTEWVTEEGSGGKSKPTKIGLAPEQRAGMEYEFDLLLEMTTEHMATVAKDRSGKFQDKIIEKPGEEFGREILVWLSDGSADDAPLPEQPKPPHDPVAALANLSTLLSSIGLAETQGELEALLPKLALVDEADKKTMRDTYKARVVYLRERAERDEAERKDGIDE